jgi:hypothetical protein
MTKNYPFYKYCFLDLYNGESGAFRCLAAGKGEVAFIELNTIKQNTGNSKSKISHLSYTYLLDIYLILIVVQLFNNLVLGMHNVLIYW